MSTRAITAMAAALLLLAGCSSGTPAEEEPVAQRGPVSPDGVMLVSPTELAVDLTSCNGDPIVDELVEDDGQVSIRIVTTMVVSGASDSCADALTVTLEDPLDGRTLIDLVSGETLTVTPLPDVDPDSLATRTERRPVSLAGWEVSQVGPEDLSFDVPSCNGNPVVDQLVEADGYVRIKVVTTMVVSGDAADCLDSLDVSLREPLGDRPIIDWESGETLQVTSRETPPRASDELGSVNLADIPAGTTQAAFVDGHPVFVVHDDSGDVRVLDAVSPHVGRNDFTKVLAWCDSAGVFEDLWHGSRFGPNGSWLGGPAPTGMAPYAFELEDGKVAVGNRLAAPARSEPVDLTDEAFRRAGPSCDDRTALYLPGHPADNTVIADLIVHEPAVQTDDLWYPTEERVLGNVQTHP